MVARAHGSFLAALFFAASLFTPPVFAGLNEAEEAQVRLYCADYARAVADAALKNPEREIVSELKKSPLFLRALNGLVERIFHPKKYRFSGGYRCMFGGAEREPVFRGKVTLLLTRNLEYAEHHRRPQIMFLDLGRVINSPGEVAHYILPKYLSVNDESFSVSDARRF